MRALDETVLETDSCVQTFDARKRMVCKHKMMQANTRRRIGLNVNLQISCPITRMGYVKVVK